MAQVPVYYWDNQQGLVPATKNCVVEKSKSKKFGVSQYYNSSGKTRSSENLRNRKGVAQSNLMNGSIVKFIDDKSKRKNNFEYVEVVGINQDSDSRIRWKSQRGDKGYLFYRSVLPIEDVFLKIQNENLPALAKTKLADVTETFWHQLRGKTFYELKCDDMKDGRDYSLFKVYKKNSPAPEMLVAVSGEETSVFEKFETLSKKLAYKYVPSYFDGEKQNVDYTNLEIASTKVSEVDVEAAPERVFVEAGDEKDQGGNGIDDVVCLSTEHMNVRNDQLERSFLAKSGEQVKIFQSFDGNLKKKKVIGGEEYTFIKVELFQREEKDERVGWMAKRFIKPVGKCPYVNKNIIEFNNVDTITGLDDPDCCNFPTVKKATDRFNSGMRRFGAGRSKGRLHAACDLYREYDEDIMTVAPGKIITSHRYFYLGTYQITVKHSGGFIARYGEISSYKAKGTNVGDKVKMGQRIGRIGKLVGIEVSPMLHFELYEGTKSGSLTDISNGSKYQRRSDLMDPTKYLLKWESTSF